MTLRRLAHTSLIATALVVGAASLPLPAAAASVQAPAIMPASVQSVAPSERGDDALVGLAASGIDAWSAYRMAGDGPALQRYRLVRDSVARAAAHRLGIVPARMVSAWRHADVAHQLVILTAFTQLGTPYHAYQRRPGQGFDCSGFTSWVWGRTGVVLNRTSRSQIRAAADRTADTAQVGDLAYYPGHVMLYLGVDNAIIHSPQTGRSVSLDFVGSRHTRSVRFGNPLG
jgi:cell wall-associated NlpC family hydrolase